MITYGLYNSGLKYWNDDHFNLTNYLLYRNGGVLKDDDLVITEGSGLSVVVSEGFAMVITDSNVSSFWLNLKWFLSDEDKIVNIATADVTNPRYDLVCAKIDLNNKTATIVSSADDVLMKGVASGSPAIPSVPQGYTKIGHVYVPAGLTEIDSSHVFNTRTIIEPLLRDIQQIVKNKTLSTGVKLDENADENITYYGIARQALINGNFDVWQRNTSFTNPSAGYTADRWRISLSMAGLPGTLIHSRRILTPGELDKSFYHYRINPNGAGTVASGDIYQFGQLIRHGTRYLCGNDKKVTVSFYARSNISGKKLGVYLYQAYGTGGSPTSGEIVNGANVTLTSSWTKYVVTITTNTLAGKTFGTNNDDVLELEFMIAWGSTNAGRCGAVGAESFGGSGNIDIAQVQLVSGDKALPFNPRSFNEELLMCQDYYRKSWNYAVTPGTATNDGMLFLNVGNATTGSLTITGQYGRKMVKTPNLTIYDAAGTINKIYKGANGKNYIFNWNNEEGFTITSNDATSTSQMGCHYTADSEL